MPVLKVKGIPPLDGEYEFQIDSFTNRELHMIKQETGVRAGEIAAAFEAGDNDMLVAIALIALQRAGKGEVAHTRDLVWDADAGQIEFDFTDSEQQAVKEEEALPPESGLAVLSSGSEPNGSSGLSSGAAGASPPSDRSRTGSPA